MRPIDRRRDGAITPDVSVVLVNFRSGEFGARAVASVRRQRGCTVELVVVDNASDDGSLERIIELATPEVVIRNAVNTGYAAAVDQGCAAASAPIIVPMNCDAELGDEYLSAAISVLDRHPEVAVVGGVVEHPDGSIRGPQELTITMRTSDLPITQARTVVRVDASCPVWRRAAVEQVARRFGTGVLDERFFVYGENVDLACKLRRLGWQCWFEPALRATHARSTSSAERVADKRGELRTRVLLSRYVNVVRHVGGRAVVAGLIGCVLEDLVFVVTRLATGDLGVVRDVAASWREVRSSFRSELAVRRTVEQVGVERLPLRWLPPRRHSGR